SSTAEKVQQGVFYVARKDKNALLHHILKDSGIKSVLVFTRTKHGADKVMKNLQKSGIKAQAIHGNKSQTARQAALNNFKTGATRVLVATDIAARGIDVEELSHVINYELPNVPETYVHRIGRTGRAGASGTALSFCDEEEVEYLRDINKLIGKQVPIIEAHPYPLSSAGMLPVQVPNRGSAQKTGSSHKSNGQPSQKPGGGQKNAGGGSGGFKKKKWYGKSGGHKGGGKFQGKKGE
ncbi:MAG: ATP-dependent helicase, partial [Bacteroidetes bacterium]|nr:ATP-dependent helicase [Bacteroidota bacterium]